MRLDLIDALIRRYEGDVLAARANIKTYVEGPVGIGEHPDIVGAVHEEIVKLAEARELLGNAMDMRKSLEPAAEPEDV